MVQTRKFSQFGGPSPIQPNDIVVGLRSVNGALVNFQFTGAGSGGGGSGGIIKVIDQENHDLDPGNWVRVDVTGNYVKAQADTSENAEVVGTVLNVINVNQFTLQTIGYVDSGTFSGMNAGEVWFLSPTTPGAMTLIEPRDEGTVSLPVLIATDTDKGWIRQWRGMVNNGIAPVPTGGNEDTSIVVVHQENHDLLPGHVVRLAGSVNYVKAKADTYENSLAVGVVIERIGPDDFILQTSGYNIGAITQDDQGNPVDPGTTYYLSATLEGAIGAQPTAAGLFSRPMFTCEQAGGNPAGYILEQRSLAAPVGTTNASPYIFLGYLDSTNNFSSEDILIDENGNTYGAYQIILHSGDELAVGYGVRATGANPINIGLQFFIDGMWQTTLGNYASYMSGVNSTGAINTATMWASVVNGGFVPGRDLAQILPATSTHVGIITGNGILTCAPSSTTLTGSWICVDSAPATPEGYTCIGWSGCDAGIGQATGFRIAFGNGGVLTPGSTSYFIVYGIPNS